MFRFSRRITLPIVLAMAAAVTLTGANPGTGPVGGGTAATLAAAPTAVVPGGRDYASDVFHDPWDYSNPSDVVLNTGPAQGLRSASMSGGLLSFSVHSGYFSPLWGGYNNEVPTGRLGTVAANQLNASTYNRLRLHIYVSAFTAASLSWYACASSCSGGMTIALQAGWNDIDRPITRSVGSAWSGHMQGLRFALHVPHGYVTVHVDTMRIYDANTASVFTWAAPGASKAGLWWTNAAGTINATRSQHAGPVTGAATSENSSDGARANVSGYAPDTAFWSVTASGTKTLVGRTASTPMPIIDSPSAVGCGGYKWTFTSPSRLAGHANIGAISYTKAGELSATNAGPNRNDPNISLPVHGGIWGRTYHRLTFVESYDGGFSLSSHAGGGAMARILWQQSGHVALSQTAPLVTFTGKRSITVDMAGSHVIEKAGTAAQRYPFGSSHKIIRLRYDPNEDPGARRWHLYSVRLAADCSSATTFAVSWHDTHYASGSTVRMVARSSAGRYYELGSTTEHSGQNSHSISVRSLPRGRYSVGVYVTNPSGITTSTLSSGPLVKT